MSSSLFEKLNNLKPKVPDNTSTGSPPDNKRVAAFPKPDTHSNTYKPPANNLSDTHKEIPTNDNTDTPRTTERIPTISNNAHPTIIKRPQENNKRPRENTTDLELTAAQKPTNELAGTRKTKIKKNPGRPATGRRKASVHVRLEPEIWQEAKEFAVKKGFELSQLVEFALTYIMNPENNKRVAGKEKAGLNVPHEEDDFLKADDNIIKLYKFYNFDRKWTATDDMAAAEFNEHPIEIVELGILYTWSNKGYRGQINSFRYFIPEIQHWHQAGVTGNALKAALFSARRGWNNHFPDREVVNK